MQSLAYLTAILSLLLLGSLCVQGTKCSFSFYCLCLRTKSRRKDYEILLIFPLSFLFLCSFLLPSKEPKSWDHTTWTSMTRLSRAYPQEVPFPQKNSCWDYLQLSQASLRFRCMLRSQQLSRELQFLLEDHIIARKVCCYLLVKRLVNLLNTSRPSSKSAHRLYVGGNAS